jgi:hypothetical protein
MASNNKICEHIWSENLYEGLLSRCCHLCNEWEKDLKYELMLRTISNIALLAKRIRKTDPINASHLLRFCREAGWEYSVLRDDF